MENLKRTFCSRPFTFFIVILLSCILLGYYYNRFWCPQDEGVFAHVAQRILDGEVLNKHIEELHPGYANFINALALGLFGRNFVSLRYPLIFAALLQSCFIFKLFSARSCGIAVLAALIPTVLGLLQFLNPNPHWYCLFCVIALICSLNWMPREGLIRIFVAGFWIGLTYLFRQPSGILAGIAVLTYLLLEGTSAEKRNDSWLAKTAILIMFVSLSYFLCKESDLFGFLLFGIWPLLVLIWSWRKVNIPNPNSLRIITVLALGVLFSALPLLVYHLRHGSLVFWFHDSFLTAMNALEDKSLNLLNYTMLVQGGFRVLLIPHSFTDILNGFYWIALPLIASLNGIATLCHLRLRQGVYSANLILPFIAVFYAVVSLHNQIPIYINFSVSLSLLGLLWLALGQSKRNISVSLVLMFIFLCAVGLYFHAAQPLARGWEGVLRGQRVPYVSSQTDLPNNGLWFEADTVSIYKKMVALIEKETGADDAIFVLPNNAELYFLTRRKNPFRFSATDLSILSIHDAQQVIDALKKNPPKLIIYSPGDKRNNSFSKLIMDFVKQDHRLFAKIEFFEIYR